MADGSDGTDVSPESEATAAAAEKGGEIWGTLEELLLACAVTRHGTASWDSVAMEVQTRSPLAARPGLTPHSCRLRFRHLHRRFSTAGSSGGDEEDEVEEDPDASTAEGWVDELRRLRVAELRRDVERCDLSIGTLQSKVKRLREERERSVSGEATKPDEASGNDRLSGEEPGRSCRESNSTDLKPPKHPGHQGGGGAKEEEVAKQEASGESAAASKESSDVRSSASLCRRRQGSVSGKAEEEEAASAPHPPPALSAPLAALLDAVAAKLGSVLQRLHEHEGEEAASYRTTIRRHVDLEAVRRRLDTSAGSRAEDDDHYPAHELYRDLLLLCTNAVVFFPRRTPEHAAAVEGRALVTGHASAALRDPKQERASVGAAPAPAPAGADIVGSLIEKGKPLIVCRKRSSIAKAARKEESAAKAEADAAEEEEEEEEEESEDDEKKAVAAATKDKARGLRTKKGRGGAVRNPSGHGLRPAKGANDDDAATDGAKKGDKKGSGGAAAGGPAKKRNAVDFLKRLNQSPSRKRGSPLGTTRKRSAAAAVEQETTTTRRGRGAGRKEGTGRGGSRRGRGATGTKRGVGRPLKRGPAPATPPPSKRAKTTNTRSEKSSGTGKRGGRGGR
ncbi:hypothetical protein BAE44_0022022 [Dichanthelium oligosanthes]|uniref:Myb-like domain-containing protein n=1 Tax=Dichanthelium oligosanthes TaxID=888268 RepID=A0A1E5UVQ3_9POAL|nr:hypothetical protein BAE44_0022022 [Dichanthelium oligosanthes]